jgi:iron complex transport system ATP-binding protein
VIRLKDITVVLDGSVILSGVHLDVVNGEMLGIVGPNGAGKSTLLRVASGELAAPGVFLDDDRVSDVPVQERALRLAVLSQSSRLDFPFTAHEVILMGRIPHSSSQAVNLQLASDVIEELGLAALTQRVYTTLSGGEQQRVQLARVLVQIWDRLDGAHLLLDEPTGPLDLKHQHTTLGLLARLRDRGVGVVVILHDINLAYRYCDRIALMQGGRIVAEGPPAEALSDHLLERVFDVKVTTVGEPGQRSIIVG